MTIRYVHNDPAAVPFLQTRRSPRLERTGPFVKFRLPNAPTEQIYAIGDSSFVFWQCRDAALASIDAWERVAGPLRDWQNRSRVLDLHPNRAVGLEANYDRSSVSFYHWQAHGMTTFTGASTDAVSHEIGHAILDAVRPDLWNSFYSEVAAFHEGFADCITLLVALFDNKVAKALVDTAASPDGALGNGNLAEQVAESVAAAFKASFGAHHPASRPRQLKNTLQWSIPTTLPRNPTATNLSREPHSFGRVITGCFYDTIDNVFRAQATHTVKALQKATETVGALLAAAVTNVPEDLRFYRAIGRGMILADEANNGGANHMAIRDAFVAHNIALGSSAMLAPSMSLDGPPPATSGKLNVRARRDLIRRVGARRDTRVSLNTVKLGGRRVTWARLRRPVYLSDFHGTAYVNDTAMLGGVNNRCAVLGELPNTNASDDEVASFVRALASSGALRGQGPSATGAKPTHVLRRRGGRSVLTRIGFSCTAVLSGNSAAL